MLFAFVKPTLSNLALLSSDSGEPVARPVPLLSDGRKVGVVRETIGPVRKPFYLAELAVDFRKLVGKQLESG